MVIAISYETSADGFGDEATEADRYAFARFVEAKLEERFPGADVDVDVDASVLESRCRVTGGADIDEAELAQWIGVDLWDEWCSEGRAAAVEYRVRTHFDGDGNPPLPGWKDVGSFDTREEAARVARSHSPSLGAWAPCPYGAWSEVVEVVS
jgi:hypothetical protein